MGIGSWIDKKTNNKSCSPTSCWKPPDITEDKSEFIMDGKIIPTEIQLKSYPENADTSLLAGVFQEAELSTQIMFRFNV